MKSDTASLANLTDSPWVRRLRLWLAIGLGCALLHVLVTSFVLPRGHDRPIVFLAGATPLAAAPLLLSALWAAAAAGALLAGRPHAPGTLQLTMWSLAIWAAFGGTMADWLRLSRPLVGPPDGAPYGRLLPDYALLLVAVVGIIVIGAALSRRGGVTHALQLRQLGREWVYGVGSLAVTSAVALAVMWPLMGPAQDATLRGQVYFAVAVAFIAGPAAARYLLGPRHPAWYWAAPFVVGVVGLAAAALRPTLGLPPRYAHRDLIPAWGAARPLPVEMTAVGLLATLYALRADEVLWRGDSRRS